MYRMVIITKYNAIFLEVADIHDPEIEEILAQPWVVQVRYWLVSENGDEKGNFKKLVRRKYEKE